MLEIKMRLSIAFYPQTDGQIEQYLKFFIEYRQRN